MTLRRISRQLVALVLFLYAAALGVAIAAPVVNPQAMSLICTSTGYKLISQQDKDSPKSSKSMTHLLDCSFCLATGITPVLPQQDAVQPVHALSYALRSIPAARLAAIVSAPLPARGPPA
ncbi:DUF2946 family protein [Undibacterium sp. RuTC16W]|uniref:DUF2946 family protein n=1 Tax=Undibacterium sp. RuTC16W TaxID=3413048 RepID=UPI003BF33101